MSETRPVDGASALPEAPELLVELEAVETDAWEDLYRAAPPATANRLGIDVERVGSTLAAVAARTEPLALNRPLGLGIGEPVDESTLGRVLDRYRDAPHVFVPVAPQARPPELYGWLRRRGFESYNHWIKFYRSPVGAPAQPEAGLRVERADAGRGDEVGAVITAAFEMPAAARPWFRALAGRDRWVTYLALDGEKPVAAATLFHRGGTAWIGFGSTLPAHRGRGAQQALLAARVRDAAELGCTMIVVETGENDAGQPNASGRNVMRAGFHMAYRRPNMLWRRGDTGGG